MIVLSTALHKVLELALPFHLPTMRERQVLTVRGRLFGAMNPTYRTKASHSVGGTF